MLFKYIGYLVSSYLVVLCYLDYIYQVDFRNLVDAGNFYLI